MNFPLVFYMSYDNIIKTIAVFLYQIVFLFLLIINTVKPALVTTSIKLVKPALVTTSIKLQSNLL